MKSIDTIIWDWNGTLLNDIDLCVDSINRLLLRRGHPQLTMDHYREIFTFPVKDYYVKAGFDFTSEPFDEVAVEFIDLYRDGLGGVKMHPEARGTLECLSGRGYRQYLVSAMEHGFLTESLKNCGVDQYFDDFTGIRDHFADGKTAMARQFIRKTGIDPARALFVGDTLHDHEVASQLGMSCMLVANGHQSEVRLLRSGCHVVSGLREAVEKITGNGQLECPDQEITE